jgi:hypothetical protein
VIYCVVPEELAGELLPRLESYYADDPNGGGNREVRDRRRPRVTGELPQLATD